MIYYFSAEFLFSPYLNTLQSSSCRASIEVPGKFLELPADKSEILDYGALCGCGALGGFAVDLFGALEGFAVDLFNRFGGSCP